MPDIIARAAAEKFRGVGRPFTQGGLRAALAVMDLTEAHLPHLWAVLTVESRGFGFEADRRPKILFERHVFSRRTKGRFDATAPDLSNPRPGGYRGGTAEYERLGRAVALCEEAGLGREPALSSASWGLGQVMGFNAATVGFAGGAEAMLRAFLEGEDAHLRAMGGFIAANGLARTLRDADWAGFARGYNGPNFHEHHYDLKLAAAHARFAAGITRDVPMRAAQAALLYLGHAPGDVDGIIGDNTRNAIRRWREKQGLPSSDRLDGPVFDQLMRAAGF
jgi:hypothetical protein